MLHELAENLKQYHTFCHILNRNEQNSMNEFPIYAIVASKCGIIGIYVALANEFFEFTRKNRVFSTTKI